LPESAIPNNWPNTAITGARSSEAEIAAALTGHYKPEHVFALQQNFELFDAVQSKITACDHAIEAHVKTLTASVDPPTSPDTHPPFHQKTPRQ
jgi:hypothetical protein